MTRALETNQLVLTSRSTRSDNHAESPGALRDALLLARMLAVRYSMPTAASRAAGSLIYLTRESPCVPQTTRRVGAEGHRAVLVAPLAAAVFGSEASRYSELLGSETRAAWPSSSDVLAVHMRALWEEGTTAPTLARSMRRSAATHQPAVAQELDGAAGPAVRAPESSETESTRRGSLDRSRRASRT